MNEEILKQVLQADEDILFSSSPTRRLYTKNEMIRNPISFALIGAFLIYYYFFAAIDPKILTLTLSIAAVFVVYNVVIKMIIKTITRSRTSYILTDSRVLFILLDSKGQLKKCVPFKLSSFASSVSVLNKDATGSVIFSETADIDMYPIKVGNNWISYGSGVVPVFFDIAEPETAREMFIEARKNTVIPTEEISQKPFSKYDE